MRSRKFASYLSKKLFNDFLTVTTVEINMSLRPTLHNARDLSDTSTGWVSWPDGSSMGRERAAPFDRRNSCVSADCASRCTA